LDGFPLKFAADLSAFFGRRQRFVAKILGGRSFECATGAFDSISAKIYFEKIEMKKV
jgi:hypothetical protein